MDRHIAPGFAEVLADIRAGKGCQYKLSGGRGSAKSSFVSLMLVGGLLRDAERGEMTHAVAFRRYRNALRDSVVAQMEWAVGMLSDPAKWTISRGSPAQMTYKETGQTILFKGADNALKLKSLKVPRGYIRYLWFEELAEFESGAKVRSIRQSIMRGGAGCLCFYTYNPPRGQRHWVNDPQEFAAMPLLSHHSTYESVPKEWLGEAFLAEARHIRRTRPDVYEHEYLGISTGTGEEVFSNLAPRRITAAEIREFDNIRQGVDWGYASDPFHYTALHYDSTRRRVFIFDEIHKIRLSNRKAAERILKKKRGEGWILADSAEPKSIADFRAEGLRIRKAKKGAGSVEYGIKWLSEEVERIVIDPDRCPNTWREFRNYALDSDENGNLAGDYPDRNNHSIDAVRYALSEEIRGASLEIWDGKWGKGGRT